MKKSLLFLIMICLLMILTGCGNNFGLTNTDTETNSTNNSDSADNFVSVTSEIAELESGSSVAEEESNMLKIEILIGNEVYTATLYDNAATRNFMDMLPLTLDMSELNGNEKYYYLDTGLPTNASKPSGIKTGDLMLYGDSCLVLFYESFSTSYTYTQLGYIDDPIGLAAALGSGSAQVTFRKG